MGAGRPYRLFAAFFAAAAIYHLIEASGIAFSSAPLWRHALWVVIDAAMAWALLHPRPWLLWPLAVITFWSLYSHGWLALVAWRATGEVDWLSLVVILALPVMLARLICDRRSLAAIH